MTGSHVLLPMHEDSRDLYCHGCIHLIGIMTLALTLYGKGERCTNQSLARRPVIWEVSVWYMRTMKHVALSAPGNMSV